MPVMRPAGRYPHGTKFDWPKRPGTHFRPYDVVANGRRTGLCAHECWMPWENPDAAEFLEIVW